MNRLAALIYAGGRGTRMGGVIKANVAVGGVRLLERVSMALGPIASGILVAHGAIEPALLGLLPGQIAVPDLDPPAGGPLAGLAGAIEWCLSAAEPPDLLLTCAVDTPFMPADFAARMRDALAPGDNAVVAAFAGQPYPTNALWRCAAIADLPRRMRAGTAPKSLSRLAAELRARMLEWPDDGSGDPFANVNTPADLAALEGRAARR